MKKRRKLALIPATLGILLIVCFCIYQVQVQPIDKTSHADIEVIIPSGMSTDDIANLLHDKGLIRSPLFFKIYVKLNGISSMKASTYLFQKSMSLDEIAASLEQGSLYNPDAISITFQEGQSIKDYAKTLASKTNIGEQEFLDIASDPTNLAVWMNQYWFLTEDILNEEIYYPLEGYLAPDTYFFENEDVTAEEVINTLLKEEGENLEPYREILENTNIHDMITMASITELEGVNETDRKMIVGVFQNRLAQGMNLGSDVTTYYAFDQEMTGDLSASMFQTYNPYNTRSSEMAGRLPVGPICNPSLESIDASINPTANDYLYFVADKNGKIYYTRTMAEHEQAINTIKENGDWIW